MSTLKVSNIQATGETASRAVSGVAAAWVNFNGTGTIAARDSENVSSLTDNGTSDYTANWSSSLGNANYQFAFAGSISDAVTITINPAQGVPTVSNIRVRTYNGGFAGVDASYVNIAIHGDLA